MSHSAIESRLPSYFSSSSPNRKSLISRAASHLAVRTFLIYLIITCAWVAYGRAHFYRDPGSLFYDEERAFIRWYSAHRERQGNEYIQDVAASVKQSDDDFPKARANASMCAVFLTTTQNLVNHSLERAIGTVLHDLTEVEREDVNLQIFFANSDPSRHPVWLKPWLRKVIDRVYTYADLYSFEAMADVLALERSPNSVAKGPLDYALALQQCYEGTSSPLITVFEDDIIAANSWFARTLWAAAETQHRAELAGRAGQWIYVRIFNQERSTGWVSHEVGGNHEVLISLIIAAVVYLSLMVLRRRVRLFFNIYVDTWTTAVICCVAIPTFVVLFYQSGKASLLPPSPGVREENFGCCTQALVFNREHVPDLMQYIHRSATEGHHEQLIRDYSAQKHLAKFSLYPMMVQHIPPQSTIQAIKSDSKKIWSMAFETLSAKALQKDHVKLLRKLYPGRSPL